MYDSEATFKAIRRALEQSLSELTAKTVLASALRRSGLQQRRLCAQDLSPAFLAELGDGLRLFGVPEEAQKRVLDQLASLRETGHAPPIEGLDQTTPILGENDIVEARSAVRRLAKAIGFGHTDQVKIATVVSELARNIHAYAGGGEVSISGLRGSRSGVRIVASDRGSGIRNIEDILANNYRSKTGMGLGLLGCKRLMDEFDIDTGPTGTKVTVLKYL